MFTCLKYCGSIWYAHTYSIYKYIHVVCHLLLFLFSFLSLLFLLVSFVSTSSTRIQLLLLSFFVFLSFLFLLVFSTLPLVFLYSSFTFLFVFKNPNKKKGQSFPFFYLSILVNFGHFVPSFFPVTERMGFEPMVLFQNDDLANRCLQPLSHLSFFASFLSFGSFGFFLDLLLYFVLRSFPFFSSGLIYLSFLSTTGSPTVTLLRLITNHHPASHVSCPEPYTSSVPPTLRIQTVLSH